MYNTIGVLNTTIQMRREMFICVYTFLLLLLLLFTQNTDLQTVLFTSRARRSEHNI